MAQTANLYKVKTTYYFRVRIPKDLKHWFPLHDIKRSLRTKSLTVAKRMVTFWAARTEELFTTIRTGLLTGIMTGKQIKKLVEEYISFRLKKDDEIRMDLGVSDSVLYTEDGPVRITDRAEFDPDVEIVSDELESNQFEFISRGLNEFLAGKGIEVDPESYEYKVLCRDIAYAHVNEIHQINVDRDMGNFGDKYYLRDEIVETEPDSKTIEDPQSDPPEAGVLLSELTANLSCREASEREL